VSGPSGGPGSIGVGAGSGLVVGGSSLAGSGPGFWVGGEGCGGRVASIGTGSVIGPTSLGKEGCDCDSGPPLGVGVKGN